MDRKLATKNMAVSPFFLVLFVNIDFLYQQIIKIYPKLGSLRYQIGKAGSATSFSSEDAFPNVILSAKNLKLFINDSNSKENRNNVVT